MAIKIETENLPGSRLLIRVEADAAEVDKSFDRAFSQLQAEARVPGFRPGKAPRAILERRFDADMQRRLAWQEFLEKTYAPALEDLDIEPLGEPEMPNIDEWDGFQRGQDLQMTVTWTVQPRPELPEFKNLKLVKPSAEVTPEDVDEAIEQLREANAKRQPVERTTVAAGDLVSAHVIVTKGDTEEVLEESDAELTAREDSDAPVEKALVGAPVDTILEVKVPLQGQQADEELAGGEATVKVEIKSLAENILPELTDEFAHSVDEKLNTVDELRTFVTERLASELAESAETQVRELALALVNSRTKLDLPPDMVNRMATSEMQQYAREMLSDGMSMDKVKEIITSQESGVQDAVLSETVRRLREHYLLGALAREAELEVDDEDMARYMTIYSQEHGVDEATLRSMVMMQPETESDFRERALRIKIGDFLVNHAEIEEVGREGYPLMARRLFEEAAPIAASEAIEDASAEEEPIADADSEGVE
ncbi:MAG TPA: trigger factor [Armatimonadota bacterium]|jgi:trigger factor